MLLQMICFLTSRVHVYLASIILTKPSQIIYSLLIHITSNNSNNSMSKVSWLQYSFKKVSSHSSILGKGPPVIMK